MATKARLYEVTLRNGYRNWTEIYPAQSEESLRSELNFSDDIKVIGVKSLGWAHVIACPDRDTDIVAFSITYQDKEINIFNNCIGYSYLMQQFPSQVKEVNHIFNFENQ